MPAFRALLALGLVAGVAAVAVPRQHVGVDEESSLEVPSGDAIKQPRLMRQEAAASELELRQKPYPVETPEIKFSLRPINTDYVNVTCAPFMKVSKTSTCTNHTLRTGIYKMQRKRNRDGTPIYKNELGLYMYYWNITKEWRVGWDPTRPDAGVATPPSASQCPDLAPEWWAFIKGQWTNDEGFKVLSEICAPVVIISGAAATMPQLMGDYKMTTMCSICGHGNGTDCACRPVYMNTQKYEHGTWTYFLYYWPEFGQWRIGTDINVSAASVTSTEGQQKPCPMDASGWQTFVDFKWAPNKELRVERMSSKGSIYDDFQIGNANVNECPPMTEAMSQKQCENVAVNLDKDYGDQIQDDWMPTGCYESYGVFGKVYFNTAINGAANMDAHLICQRTEAYWDHTLSTRFKKSVSAKSGGSDASGASDASGGGSDASGDDASGGSAASGSRDSAASQASRSQTSGGSAASGISAGSGASGGSDESEGSEASGPEAAAASVASAASVAGSQASGASGSQTSGKGSQASGASGSQASGKGSKGKGSKGDAHGPHGPGLDKEGTARIKRATMVTQLVVFLVLILLVWKCCLSGKPQEDAKKEGEAHGEPVKAAAH